MICGEFDIITRYFNRQKKNKYGVNIGIGDDCALVTIPKKKQLAITTDTLVAGIHFFDNISPESLAYKSLAVNLSDLAAMGADPVWVSLALTLPKINEDWLERFSSSLFEQINYYKMQLIGGDTTLGPMSLTYTVHGLIPKGKSLKRLGARDGDLIYVTGTLGDSAAGLAILKSKLVVNDIKDRNWLIQRHLRPEPRISHGKALRNLASSAIDISDGLISNIRHILKINSCGAKIKLDFLPLSDALRRQTTSEQALNLALSGGEDYELCFTIPEINCDKLDYIIARNKVNLHCIGNITQKSEEDIQYFYEDKKVLFNLIDFNHFFTNNLL
ncbi:MAG: thiamine-phosphate kinase [Arsenophonus sp.]